MKSKLLYIACLYFIFVIGGCVDENIVPNTDKVHVQLYDDFVFPTDLGCILSTGQYPIVHPDGTGNAFLITNIIPYDITIKLEVLTIDTIYNDLEVFNDLHSKELCLRPSNVGSSSQYNSLTVTVQYPLIEHRKIGLLKFISKEIFEDSGSDSLGENSSSKDYRIFLPITKNSISGKFIFIKFTGNNRNNIISFDNFGEKNVVLNLVNNSPVIFNDNDLNFNPDESSIGFDVRSPSEYSVYNTIYISFNDYYSKSDVGLHFFKSNRCSTSSVPANLPLNFKIKLYSEVLIDENWTFLLKKWVTAIPGSFIDLDNSKLVEIYTPTDYSFNVSDTTVFRFGDNESAGVYNIDFTFLHNFESFVTTKNFISLAELKKKGLIFPHNVRYQWKVEKYSEFNSIDEFLSQHYTLNPSFKTIIASRTMQFETK